MDSNLHFCRRLAEEALKPPPLEPTPLFDLRHEIVRLFSNLADPITVEELTLHLKDDPRAQAELAVLSEYTPSKWLLERELEARGLWPVPGAKAAGHPDAADASDAYVAAARANATGLCFSGGGIRSATFNLGVLQALAGTQRLGEFTYLSSVSGGGYIHQFLAAWIHNRGISDEAVYANISAGAAAAPVPPARTALEEVQQMLEPHPAPAAARSFRDPRLPHSTLSAQPLRWLARYSNYLAPRKGLIGLDTWTIFAVWLRNSLLNLVVLLSSFIALLLLPHVPITRWIIARSAALPHQGVFDIVVAVAMFTCFVVPGFIFSRWVRAADCPTARNPPFWQIMGLVLVLFTAACIAAPAVYRSSLPCEFSFSDDPAQFAPCRSPQHALGGKPWPNGELRHPAVNPVFDEPPVKTTQLHYNAHFQQQTEEHEPDTLTVEAESHALSPVSQLRTHWWRRPVSFLPHPFRRTSLEPGHYSEWITRQTSFPATRIAFVLGNAAALLLLGFAAKDETAAEAAAVNARTTKSKEAVPDPYAAAARRYKEQALRQQKAGHRQRLSQTGVRLWGYPLLAIVGIAFSWLLLFGVRTLFFVAAFSTRPELISSLGVVLLPPLLFGVPFVTLELGVGLVGDLLSDEKREWIARLRAASFLTGAAWLVLTGFSLLGPELFDWVANTTATRWTVWAGWFATTVGGVLAGRSARVNGSTDPDEGQSKTSVLLQTITVLAPPVFIMGMLLLVAKLTNWSIASVPTPYVQPTHLRTIVLSFAGFASVFAVFGWRININDFSMHAFYRDRLARCYAGASNPQRKPNSFTGFALTDRQIPVTALLGAAWRHGPEPMSSAMEVEPYTGPFPIICTAVNLTTGEDLAYQERKAASFVFTPLYSGFDVGRTAGTDKRVQFNGYIPTKDYVYTDQGGISLATAVAISGAAASPNMGYHSNPAMAFLMTVFNVRLGWWLRNPRRRQDQPGGLEAFLLALGSVPQSGPSPNPWEGPPSKQPAALADTAQPLASVPQFGPWRLLDELLGQANDSSKYIYLTDGGHFDNMGLYELIRRRCRRIVVCDAEADSQLHFEGLGMAIRKARLDFGVEIVVNGVDPVLTEAREAKARHASAERSAARQTFAQRGASTSGNGEATAGEDAAAQEAEPGHGPQPMTVHFETQTSESGEMGVSGEIAPANLTREQRQGVESFKFYPGNKTHAVYGTIRYPEAPDELGHILYIKSSLTGDEPVDVLNFWRDHRSFPHDTTLNQFFTESQFESYRRLGQHIIEEDATVLEWMEQFLPPNPVTG